MLRHLFCLVLLTLGMNGSAIGQSASAPSLSAENCRVVAHWGQLRQELQTLLQDKSFTGYRILARKMSDTPTDFTRSKLRTILHIKGNPPSADVLYPFVDQLSAIATTPPLERYLSLLNTPQHRAVVNMAESSLAALGCDSAPIAAKDTLSSVEQFPQNAAPLSALHRMNLSVGMAISIFCVAIAAGAALWFAVSKAQVNRQRNGKRFTVNRVINFRLNGAAQQGKVIDISCGGLKLYHNGTIFADMAKPDLDLPSGTIASKVVWFNEFYAGLVFHQPLSPAALARDVKWLTERPSNWKPQT